jgi:Tfp pilus assembly protein PilF
MTPAPRWTLVVVAFCATLSGCATVKRIALNTDDISMKQEQRMAEAVRAFESQRDAAQLTAAQARWREGNTNACRESLDNLLTRNPKYYDAQIFYAEVLLSEEHYDAAREHLEVVLAEKENDARVQHLMGLLLQAKGQPAEALVCYRRAAELEPDNEQFQQSCQFAVTDNAQQAGHADPIVTDSPAEAPRPLPPAPDEPPGLEKALADGERALASGDVPKARALLSKAVTLDPNNPHVLVRAGVLALRYEQSDLAIQLLQPASSRLTDSAALARTLGMAYYRKADYASAQGALDRALSLDKTHALSYLLMGCTLEKLGQSQSAEAHYEHARRLDPRLNVRP